MNDEKELTAAAEEEQSSGAEEQEAPREAEYENEQTTDPETVERAEVERLVAEAEQRGYVRGRTEALNERLAGPDLYQEPECKNPVTILAGIRSSVWNN